MGRRPPASGRQVPGSQIASSPAPTALGVEPPTHFPIVHSSAIDGYRWSAGDARNPLRIIELEVVARDGPIREANQDSEAARRARIGVRRSESIEPSTRGFSVARRARFGVSKQKSGNEFSRGRPNRPRRPSSCRTPAAPDRANPAACPCGSWGCGHRERAGAEPRRPAPGSAACAAAARQCGRSAS